MATLDIHYHFNTLFYGFFHPVSDFWQYVSNQVPLVLPCPTSFRSAPIFSSTAEITRPCNHPPDDQNFPLKEIYSKPGGWRITRGPAGALQGFPENAEFFKQVEKLLFRLTRNRFRAGGIIFCECSRIQGDGPLVRPSSQTRRLSFRRLRPSRAT